jgi:apolipoprotein D and lipocalin family protein
MRNALCLALALLAAACEREAPLEVSQGLELTRFQGKWYEIASLPRPSQAGCVGTTAEYRLASERELLVVNECHQGTLTGPVVRAAARAVVADPDVPAKLSLDFGFAFGDYWVLEVGESYEYAVVGHPTRDYLWILSRTPLLPQATLQDLIRRAKTRGFPTGMLRSTQQ